MPAVAPAESVALEELDHAAITYLVDGRTEGLRLTSCPAFMRDWMDRERGSGRLA